MSNLHPDYLTVVPRRVLEWHASGTTGVSAETMVHALLGVPRDKYYCSPPIDVGDFARCVRALDWMPWLRDELHRLPALRPRWAGLVREWAELEYACSSAATTGESRDSVSERIWILSKGATL